MAVANMGSGAVSTAPLLDPSPGCPTEFVRHEILSQVHRLVIKEGFSWKIAADGKAEPVLKALQPVELFVPATQSVGKKTG
jgi:hypothetical protein